MAKDYFILTGKGQTGPYDLVMLVRKIRNGSLDAATVVYQDDPNTGKPASQWAELVEFLDEKKVLHTDHTSKRGLQRRSLAEALQSGWRFLQRNQTSTVLGGAWVLMVIMMMGAAYFGLPVWAHATVYVLCFIFSHFLLCCYLFSVLRMTRGQPIGFAYMFSKIGPLLEPLLFSSTYVSVTAILGLILFTNSGSWEMSMVGLLVVAIPGLLILTLYAFTPLIVLDQGYRLWEAMEMSRKAVLKSGIENIGVLYALFVINFIGGLFVILPMAITLPITMSALAEIYDESF